MVKNTLLLVLGIIIYPLKFIVPVKKGLCIFGADKGANFSQNSRYFFLHMIERHKGDYDYVWVTQSQKVLKLLRQKGIPVVHNLSLKGILYSLSAEYTIFSTGFFDILFSHTKKGKHFIYLTHGMPTKYCHYDFVMKASFMSKINGKLSEIFIRPQRIDTVSFIPTDSAFFKKIMLGCCRNPNIYVTGEPRTDILFKLNQIEVKKQFGFEPDDFIISYMPTHRYYGKGPMTPDIFRDTPEAIEFFKKNKIKVIWKHHMNMVAPDYNNTGYEDCFKDLSNSGIDSQYMYSMSDIMITDHSSVYIDYMLFRRPIIFYWYDDFEQDDTLLYYKPNELGIGAVCHNETEMLELIKKYYSGEKQPDPQVEFHKYHDSGSCERVYRAVFKGEVSQFK